MINSQEIIERSVYTALLNMAVKLGYTIDPMSYLPISSENQARQEADIGAIRGSGKPFIYIFGAGNNQSKDQKITPRIVVEPKAFYPGNIGVPPLIVEKKEGEGFTMHEEPWRTLDQYIDVRLVANTQEDLRILHQIMFWALPNRGYIKPYTEARFLFTGNIFIEAVNYYDSPNLQVGLLEKVYEYVIEDNLLENTSATPAELPEIKDISAIINVESFDGSTFQAEINTEES